jgi:hypothetical protein
MRIYEEGELTGLSGRTTAFRGSSTEDLPVVPYYLREDALDTVRTLY